MEPNSAEALNPGETRERRLEPGGRHDYTFELATDHYARIEVEQKGLDVYLELFDPGGSLLTEVDSPTGTEGTEAASVVGEPGGAYRLAVVSSDPEAEPGGYVIRLTEPRPATEENRIRVATERVFHQGETLRRARKSEEAIPLYREALSGWRSLEDATGEAQALHRLGWMLGRSRRYEEGLGTLNSARELFQQTGDRRMEGGTLNLIGRIHLRLGDPRQALEAHRRALEIFEQLGNLEGRAAALDNLGNLHKRAGRIEEAFRCFEQALEIWQQVGYLQEQAATRLSLGDLYLLQNELEAARSSLERARSLGEETEDSRAVAIALRRLGDVHDRRGQQDEAREVLERALEIQREGEDHRGMATTLSSLGTVAMKRGDLAAARDHLEDALEHCRQLEDSHLEAVVLHKLGRVAYREGELEEAHRLHSEAIPLYREHRDPRGETSATFGAARALHDLGRLEEAKRLLEQTTEAAEASRTASESLELRATYFASRAHYWELYVDTLMALHQRHPSDGYDVLAFDATERWRARSFLDLLQQGRLELREGAGDEILARERQLREQLDRLQENRLLELSRGEPSPEESLEAEEREILRQLDRVHREIRTGSGRPRDLTAPNVLRLSQIQDDLLDPETLLLAYFLGPERSYLWVVGKRSFESHVLPERETVEALARELQGRVEKPSVLDRRAQADAVARLSETILAPAAGALASGDPDVGQGPRRLVVVADGALQYIPFAVLEDPAARSRGEEEGPTHLVRRHRTIHLPSASVLGAVRERGREVEPQRRDEEAREGEGPRPLIAVVADPVFGTGPAGSEPALTEAVVRSARDLGLGRPAPLPYTRNEAEAILGMVPEDRRLGLLGHDATRDSVLQGELNSYPIVHFATHGLVHPAHPELSGLLLTVVDEDGEPRGGFLSLADVYSLDLSARLVVLSACETGLGKELQGEGLMGLTRGFFHAGASGLVVSLWQVQDRSTAELMERFYRRLFEGAASPAEALRQAQLSMLDEGEWRDPYYWAPFIFQGDWTLAPLSPDDSIEKQQLGQPPPDDYQDDDLPPPRIQAPGTEGGGS